MFTLEKRIPNPIPKIMGMLTTSDKLHEQELERLLRLEALVAEIILSPGLTVSQEMRQAAWEIKREHEEADRNGAI